MTNGEKIKEIFPNINIYEHGSTYSINNEYNFNASWWNAEYIEPNHITDVSEKVKSTNIDEKKLDDLARVIALASMKVFKDDPYCEKERESARDIWMNGICLSTGVCERDKSAVIDKIYNEISHLTFRPYEGKDTFDRKDVLEILDKYRTESENE